MNEQQTRLRERIANMQAEIAEIERIRLLYIKSDIDNCETYRMPSYADIEYVRLLDEKIQHLTRFIRQAEYQWMKVGDCEDVLDAYGRIAHDVLKEKWPINPLTKMQVVPAQGRFWNYIVMKPSNIPNPFTGGFCNALARTGVRQVELFCFQLYTAGRPYIDFATAERRYFGFAPDLNVLFLKDWRPQ